MRKIKLMISVFVLSHIAMAQPISPRLETSIKVVSGKARIVVKATGGAVTGTPGGSFTFVVAIPKVNGDAGATLDVPTVLDATRMTPLAETTGLFQPIPTYTDLTTYKYFLLLYTGVGGSVTYVQDQEYDLLELTWGGPSQTFPVTLISCEGANPPVGGVPAAPLPFQWQTYLEVGGAQLCDAQHLFYQSGTSLAPTQHGGTDATDYSTGTAFVTSSSSINTSTLPVSLLNFSGYKNGSKNTLLWTTASESNNRGFEVLRSTDGTNYSSIGFVNSLAPDGNSSSNISYSFDDNSVAGRKQYYRLKQTDIDNRSKLSNIVLITGAKPMTLSIAGLFPNPARAEVNVIIDAPGRDNVTLLVTDIYGKTVKQRTANVATGSNTVTVDISALATGSYLVKVLCKSSDCETAVSKFVKQ